MTRSEKWAAMLSRYRDFFNRHKYIPLRVSERQNEKELAHWMHLNDRRKLSHEQQRQLDNIVPGWRDLASVDQRWLRNYILLKTFVKKDGQFPVGSIWVENVDIGQWLRRQRSDFNNKKLPVIKAFILDSLTDWNRWQKKRKSINITLWRQRYRPLKKYIEANGMPATYCVVNGEPLGKWVSRIFQARREERMPENVIKAFEEINGWRWSRQ